MPSIDPTDAPTPVQLIERMAKMMDAPATCYFCTTTIESEDVVSHEPNCPFALLEDVIAGNPYVVRADAAASSAPSQDLTFAQLWHDDFCARVLKQMQEDGDLLTSEETADIMETVQREMLEEDRLAAGACAVPSVDVNALIALMIDLSERRDEWKADPTVSDEQWLAADVWAKEVGRILKPFESARAVPQAKSVTDVLGTMDSEGPLLYPPGKPVACAVPDTPRPETGPMQFGDDWPGIFIRGDNAAGFMIAIDALLNSPANPLAPVDPFAMMTLKSLRDTLAGCDVRMNPRLQRASLTIKPTAVPETQEAQRFHVWEATPLSEPRVHHGKHRVDCEMVKASDYDAIRRPAVPVQDAPHKHLFHDHGPNSRCETCGVSQYAVVFAEAHPAVQDAPPADT